MSNGSTKNKTHRKNLKNAQSTEALKQQN